MFKTESLKQAFGITVLVALSMTAMSAQERSSATTNQAMADAPAIRQSVSSNQRVPDLQPAAETLSGKITCAALASGSYKCGKNQPQWTCTLQCVSQGSTFVLKTSDKLFPISGETAQLEHFAADNVVVTGEVTDTGVKATSIAKR